MPTHLVVCFSLNTLKEGGFIFSLLKLMISGFVCRFIKLHHLFSLMGFKEIKFRGGGGGGN